MRYDLRSVVITLVLSLATSRALSQIAVSGRVCDRVGRPLPGASIGALPIRTSGWVGSLQWVEVDQKGRFSLSLSSGVYEIRGKHESAGYPDPDALFAAGNGGIFPRIVVGKEEIHDLTVRLGRRGGVLQGSTRDAQTGKPVPRAKVVIRDALDGKKFVEVFANEAGRFQYTVPSKPIVVSGSAEQYKATRDISLIVAVGEHREVNIDLQPVRSRWTRTERKNGTVH